MIDVKELQIKSYKFPTGGGLELAVAVIKAEDSIINHKKFHCPVNINEAFHSVVNSLKLHVIRDNYMLGLGILSKSADELNETESAYLLEILKKMQIFQVTLSYKRSKDPYSEPQISGVKISAKLESYTGALKGVDTGVFTTNSSYKFSEDLFETVERMKEYAVDYLKEMDA